MLSYASSQSSSQVAVAHRRHHDFIVHWQQVHARRRGQDCEFDPAAPPPAHPSDRPRSHPSFLPPPPPPVPPPPQEELQRKADPADKDQQEMLEEMRQHLKKVRGRNHCLPDAWVPPAIHVPGRGQGLPGSARVGFTHLGLNLTWSYPNMALVSPTP